MSDLKEKIARVAFETLAPSSSWELTCHQDAFRALADRILAIPEIAEALGSDFVRERQDSIRKGARRTDHRFKLGHSITVHRD